MNSRSQLVLAVVLVVGLAGCSGLSPFDSGPTYPDGYNESGITDAETAADQHSEALSDADNYTHTMNITSSSENVEMNLTTRIDEANEQADADTRADTKRGELTTEMYHDDNTTYNKMSMPPLDPVYTTNERSFSSFKESQTNFTDMEQWFENVSFEEAGTVTRDDETLYRYNATEVDDPEAFADSVDSVDSFNSTVLVDEEGIIRSFTFDVTYTSSGQTKEMSAEIRITDLGSTSVKEPGWIDKAKSAGSNGTNPFGGSGNGTTFSLA